MYTAGYFIATYIYIYLITTGLSVWLSFRKIKRLNTSDFHYSAAEVFARLACYAAYVHNWLPTFGTTFGPVINSQACLTLEDGTDTLSRKSATIYQPKTRNIYQNSDGLNTTETELDIIIGLGGLAKLGSDEDCRAYL